MDEFQQRALPLPGSREFTQQLAMYRSAGEMQEELQNPYSQYAVGDLRRALFDESMGNVSANAGSVFSSVVRAQFMDAFGIGRGTLNANIAHKSLASRVMKAGSEYSTDLGSYLYTGKYHGAMQSPAAKAMGWFIPLQMRGQTAGKLANVRWGESLHLGPGAPGIPGWDRSARFFASGVRGASRIRNSRLGGSMRAGFKSFLGWNFMLGNPEDMSLGDMGVSYAKHVALSYGIDALSSRFLRRPGALIGHISTLFKDDPLEKIIGKNGLLPDFENAGYSQKLKNRIETYRNGKNLTAPQKKNLYTKIRRQLQKESDAINLKSNGALQRNIVSRYKGLFLEAKDNVKRMVSGSLDNSATGRSFKRGLGGILNVSTSELDTLHGVTFRGAVKDTFKSTFKLAKGGTFGEVGSSLSTLASRTMRNTWTLGGYALRLANVASGVLAAGAIVNEGLKYGDKVREEYVKNMLSDRMTFTMMPEVGMTGTERTRAVEAIQNSGMSLRNYLGQEAQMFH